MIVIDSGKAARPGPSYTVVGGYSQDSDTFAGGRCTLAFTGHGN